MSEWIVELRGIAFQHVVVEADSPSEARAKANAGDITDAWGYPDWEQGADGRWTRRASRRKVHRR